MQKSLEVLIKNKPGYFKKSAPYVAELLGIDPTYDNVMDIKHNMKKLRKKMNSEEALFIPKPDISKFDDKKWIDILSGNFKTSAFNFKSTTIKKNVLVIGDIHEPFTLEGYLEFCKEQYDRFNCDTVVFIGDIIDNAFSSFHPTYSIIEQIKDIAQDYKIICLESESDNDYHNLLDEMVEMGILSKPDDTKKLYRLRRSSFITIIGSDFDAVDADIIKSNAEEVR